MINEKLTDALSKDNKENKAFYPIGVVAELIGITKQTLRLYEKHKLIKPTRRNKHRYYSDNDIRWIQCLRDLLHNKRISIEGIKKLLNYAPCWELTECSQERRENCSAYIDRAKPCWEFNSMICKSASGKTCENCVVFLSKSKEVGS